MVDSQYYLPNDVGISALDCGEAFRLLSPHEQLYAHYVSRAAWYGGLAVLLQTSGGGDISLLHFHTYTVVTGRIRKESQCVILTSPAPPQAFLVYAAGVYANMGNYKSFGDTKFIPNLPQARGITTYFSGNCCLEDAELAQKFLDSKNLSAYNTRLFKREEEGGKRHYEVRLASAVKEESAMDGEAESQCGRFEFGEAVFEVRRGDYAPLMEKAAENLEKAKAYVANDNQRQMLEEYARSFRFGSIDAHKEGSRYWIKDKGPIVECYIGFIESYRDPFGSRGEFEGFVAVVNKAMSARFARLVSSAEVLLPELPWPADFEKDRFLTPDFTSLDVLTFAGSGIPAGINIPNYDDIRQTEGFKNVSLGNVLAVAYATQKEKLTFLEEADKVPPLPFSEPAAFEVQVGLHELLGHGSGKLFVKVMRRPALFSQVSSWYQGSETWDSKFSTIASSYEECRAECVGLYLCLNKQVLSIFGHEGEDAEEVVYVNWLTMVRAGLLGLEFYTPESKSWRQAHMQARFVILRVLLEAGGGLVTLRHTTGADGRPDAIISLDRDKIRSVGQPAIEKFLRRLQVHKSTADVEGGRALYEGYSAVDDAEPHHFLQLRDTVLLRKEARKMFVQANTRVKGEAVELLEYEGSAAGLIRSFTERFPEDAEEVESALLDLSKRDAPCWC
ncbi:DPP3 peptidase, partial [Amia calva]|nr:DPP3 peptidase [Amia calva]